jgi:hypothetical protein
MAMKKQLRLEVPRWAGGIGGILLVAAMLLSAFWVGLQLSELFTEPQGMIAAQQRLVGGSKESGLVITGWIDQNRALRGTRLRSWYRIKNMSSAPIRDLRLDIHAPGLSVLQPPGWSLPGFPAHIMDRRSTIAPSSALPEIKPGFSQTFWVESKAAGRSRDSMLTAWFTWTGPLGEPHDETLELGPLRLRSFWLEQTAAWKDFLIALAPLLLPVGLAFLGFIFQSRQQRFVQERQAWASMLPFSHKINMSFYVPLSTAISSFDEELHDFRKCGEDLKKEELNKSAFFYLLAVVKELRRVADVGYYLQYRAGEKLVAHLIDDFREDLRQCFFPYERFSAAVDSIDRRDSLSTYSARLKEKPDLEKNVRELEKQFQQWDSTGVYALFLAGVVLDFEFNRIYSFWYGAEEKFPLEKCEEQLRSFFAKGEMAAERAKEIRDYARDFLGDRQLRTVNDLLKTHGRSLGPGAQDSEAPKGTR